MLQEELIKSLRGASKQIQRSLNSTRVGRTPPISPRSPVPPVHQSHSQLAAAAAALLADSSSGPVAAGTRRSAAAAAAGSGAGAAGWRTPGRRGAGSGLLQAGEDAGDDSCGEEEEVEDGCDNSGDELTARARDVLRRADKAANRALSRVSSRGSRQPGGRGALGAALAAAAAGSGAGGGGDDEKDAGGGKEAEFVELLTGADGRLGRGTRGRVSLNVMWGGSCLANDTAGRARRAPVVGRSWVEH